MIRSLPVMCAAVLAATCLAAQEPAAEKPSGLPIDAPEGWRKETIVLPPPFASGMKLRGVEELRFAPGMFKGDAETFFSYVFAMRVAPKPELTRELLKQELLAYYHGLAKAMLEGQGVKLEKKFTLDLVAPKASEPPKDESSATTSSYAGDLEWIEPFVTKKEQILHLELDTWRSADGKHAYLFVSASPAVKTATVWKQLRAMRDSFRSAHP